MKQYSITYPISLNYCQHWDKDPGWYIWREVYSNALDSDRASARAYIDNGALVVEDSGSGMAVKHLLLGVSQKSSDNAIGKFGEGLKLALVLASKHGIQALIQSGEYEFENSTDHIDGVEVLKVNITKFDEKRVSGTRVTFFDWPWDDYTDRFLSERDLRVLFACRHGAILTQNALFSNGVYVKDLPEFKWGYNCIGLEMNRDRTAVEDAEMRRMIGLIVTSMNDSKMIEEFVIACKSNPESERRVYADRFYVRERELWKKVLKSVFGDVVAGTSDDDIIQAGHYGLKAVRKEEVGNFLYYFIAETFGCDHDRVWEMRTAAMKPLQQNDLSQVQRENLRKIRRLHKRITETEEFESEKDIKIEIYDLENFPACWCEEKREIQYRPTCLTHWEEVLSTYIHEMAHAKYGATDCTDEMMEAIANVGALLYMSAFRYKWLA